MRSLLVEQFIERYKTDFMPELLDISRRLKSLGNVTGCLPTFFKEDEGLDPDDLVCALFDIPDRHLRLYCIRLTENIVIIGDGGPKTTRTWQEDPHLTKTVSDMMGISAIVRAKLQNQEIYISPSGLLLQGGLFISRT